MVAAPIAGLTNPGSGGLLAMVLLKDAAGSDIGSFGHGLRMLIVGALSSGVETSGSNHGTRSIAFYTNHSLDTYTRKL